MPFLNNLLLVSIVTEKMTVKVTPVTQIAYSQAYVCKVSPKSIEGFSYFCTLKLKYKGLCCLATPSVTSPMTCANDLANAKLLYMWLTVDSKNLFWARIFFGGWGSAATSQKPNLENLVKIEPFIARQNRNQFWKPHTVG